MQTMNISLPDPLKARLAAEDACERDVPVQIW